MKDHKGVSIIDITHKPRSKLRLWLTSQVEANENHTRLAKQSEQLQKAEERSEERGQRLEELQKLVGNMKIESDDLKDKMASREAELLQLKEYKEEEEEKAQR